MQHLYNIPFTLGCLFLFFTEALSHLSDTVFLQYFLTAITSHEVVVYTVGQFDILLYLENLGTCTELNIK